MQLGQEELSFPPHAPASAQGAHCRLPSLGSVQANAFLCISSPSFHSWWIPHWWTNALPTLYSTYTGRHVCESLQRPCVRAACNCVFLQLSHLWLHTPGRAGGSGTPRSGLHCPRDRKRLSLPSLDKATPETREGAAAELNVTSGRVRASSSRGPRAERTERWPERGQTGRPAAPQMLKPWLPSPIPSFFIFLFRT